jgi:PAS domain S-box-containing protein
MERHRTPGRGEGVDDAAATARAVVDGRGVITGWSEGARRLLGYRAEEVVGRPASGLLAEEGGGESDGANEGPPPPGAERWHGMVALRHRDGSPRRVRLVAHRRTDGRPAPDWLVVAALDGQAGRPQDEALARWCFDQTPSCTIAIYDTHLRLRRANGDMQRVMGLTEDEMRGLRLTDLILHPESDKTERLMRQVLETGETQTLENVMRAPGEPGAHAWSIALSAVRDDDGALAGVLLTAHDITGRHLAQRRLQLINDIGTRIGSTLDLTRTCQEVAEVAVPELADFVTVDLLASLVSPDGEADGRDPEPGPMPGPVRFRRLAHRSVLDGVPEAVVAPGEEDVYPAASPPAECLASGEPVLVPVAGGAPSAPSAATKWMDQDKTRAERVRGFGVHSVMAVPMSARGTTLGVVSFVRHRTPAPFEADDLLLAREITARAALSVDNARRYARERGTAMTLQRSLLPQELPRQAAVDVASRYLPTGAGTGVGGDWFDVIPLSGARVALVVGDVVGHGIHASATMGRLRTAVRTLADVDLPPDELLTHLDDLINRLATQAEAPGATATAEMGATCLYAVYDPVSRRCALARAGHPEPAVVRPGGEAEFLSLPPGPPLGLGGLPFEAAEVELPEGSLLALFTDGLIESRDRDIDEGLERLRGALTPPHGLVEEVSLEDLCDGVLAGMPPGRPADDIALLVARTRALNSSQVATWDLPPNPAVVAQARHLTAEQLAAWGLEEAAFMTELVVSELVTNAIRHAEPPIQLRLIHERGLICEVSDGSSTAPHLRRARTYDEGGRGLLLVAQLTDRWGTRHTSGGKTIWAELTQLERL